MNKSPGARPNDDDILEILRRRHDILRRFKVKKMAVFGSFARREQKPESDIDLLVEFDVPSLDNFMGLIESLEDLLGRQVDILTPVGLETIRVKEVADGIRSTLAYV